MTDFVGSQNSSNRFGIKPNTLTQYLMNQAAKKAQPSTSLVGRIENAGHGVLKDIGHPVSWTFDKLLRPMYAVEQGIDSGVKGQSFGQALHMMKKGFEGQAISGSQILNDAGLLKGHGILRGIAGLGIDVASDPLTYLTGGTDILASGPEHAALIHAGDLALETDVAANKGVEAAKAMKNVASTLSKGGDNYTNRWALASLKARALASKGRIPDELNKQLAAVGQAALKERNATEKLLPKFSAKVPFTNIEQQVTPTTLLGHQVVPALPKLSNIAKSGGLTGKLAKTWQDMFITPEGHTAASHMLETGHRHIYETTVHEMMNSASAKLAGNSSLNEDQMLGALHHFEVPKFGMKAVIKNGNSFQLNPAYMNRLMAEGVISPAEEKFVRAYHNVGQELYKGDQTLGINYKNLGEQGRLYVPHKVQQDFEAGGLPTFAQTNKLTMAGFQKARTNPQVSLFQLKKMQDAGEFGSATKVETNPLNALYARMRQGAMKRADQTLVNAYASTIGKSARLVNGKALGDLADKEAQLRNQLAIHESAHTNAMARLAEIENKGYRGIVKTNQMAPHLAEADVHNAAIQDLNKELKTLGKSAKQIAKGTTNKEIPSTWTETAAKDSYGHKIYMPNEIANSVQRYNRLIAGEPGAMKDFAAGYRKLLSNWKIAVTSINPGYRVRYSLANYVAMWTKGMSAHDIGIYSAKAANLIHKASNGDKAAVEELNHINAAGGLFGVFRGDVNTGGAALKWGGDTSKALLMRGKPISAFAKKAQDFTIYFDNLDHLSFLLWNKEAKGLSWEKSIAETKQTLFDYTHLTPFEQKTMKNIAPFYTWLRKNIPFQLRQFAENPGRQAAYAKAAVESEQAAGGDKGNILPSYIANDLAFQVPFGQHNYYTTSAGITDLRMFESKQGLWERALSSLNPLVKFPLELATNRNTFTGQPISDPSTHAYAPVSNFGLDVMKALNALHVPGASYGQTARVGPGGKRVVGPGANPYWQYLMQQTPLSNLLLVNGSGSLKRTTRGVPPETSELGGLTLTHVDPTVQRQIASINLQNQVKAEISKLRDNGVIPPSKRPNSKRANLIDSLLYKNLGKR